MRKLGWFLMALFVVNLIPMGLETVYAAKLKLYHCQSADGNRVVQDRPCAVTGTINVKPGAQQQSKTRHDVTKPTGPKPPRPNNFTSHARKDKQPVSSQAFVDLLQGQPWASQITQNRHGWHLTATLSAQNNQQPSRVSVEYFKNPGLTLNQEAFSYALNRYHRIRLTYPLLDSEFKSHPAYKVFNIIYRHAAQAAISEFYVSKADASLWVFSLQCNPVDQDAARALVAQFQALI